MEGGIKTSLRLALDLGHRGDDGVDQLLKDDADGADGIVVGGDGVAHEVRVGVRVHEGHDRDAQALGLVHGDVLTGGVHDDHCVRQLVHGADALQVALQLGLFTTEGSELLLGHHLEFWLLFDVIKVSPACDALLDRFVVGQGAAQPAVIHVELTASLSGFFHGVLSLALATHEEDALAFAGQITEEIRSGIDLFESFLKVEDVDLIPGFEDEGFHLRVPTLGLMTKMDAGFDEFAKCFE